MSKRIKIILIIAITLALIAGLGWLFFYVTEPLPILVKFKNDVSQQDAVAVIEKYEAGISNRQHIEYNNPFFSAAYPFSQYHVIEFEVGRINANLTAQKVREESGVESAYVFSRSYEDAWAHKAGYELLNPALKNQ